MLDFAAALAQLLAQARRAQLTELVNLKQALGRILAHDVIAPLDVPTFDNSAMDGYALHIPNGDLDVNSYQITQRIAAGTVGQALAAGEAARIFTGAPIPPRANAVVMQENCSVVGDQVQLAYPVKLGANIRRAGEDVRHGQVVLSAGQRLNPAMIGLAASLGIAQLMVFAPLRVGLFSTGDELIEPGLPLPVGKIYNSNRYTLFAQLQALGCELLDLGVIPDQFDATVNALSEAAAQSDILITTGGVSVGEEDHVKAAVQYLGELNLWKIAIKPGKPFAYGRIGGADFIGLPGNPVSALVTYLLLVRPFILARQGATQLEPQRLPLQADFELSKAGDRREFFRARVSASGQVSLFPHQGSGVLTSMAWAEGLVDVPAGTTVQRGDTVQFLPLTALEG